MAKATVQLTNTWQQIGTGVVTITVSEIVGNNRRIAFNESATDTDALRFVPQITDQFRQTEAKATWAKGVDITVITDSEG